MRIAYTTTFDARDVHNWSGTPYHMSRALSDASIDVDYIGSLSRKLPPFFKAKQIWNKYVSGTRESPRFNVTAAKYYSEQVANRLKQLSADAVISPLINPIAYLDCKQPIVLWTDAVYAALVGFYPPFAHHSASSVNQGNQITAECLSRCKLAIFSSEWAANSALELYGASKDKVKVVTYGANLENAPDQDHVRHHIRNRSDKTIKLLFLAKSWERKGGDIVVAVAKALHAAGHTVELNIVGYTPTLSDLPPYIHLLGFISKQRPEGKARIASLLNESHFLFLPSRADACPMVFAEANAHGLPCLTSYVGGISSAVKDHINGMTFALDASLNTYCDYIVNTIHNRTAYEALALSSLNEYRTRLNWQSATQNVKQLIQECL
jgi:glycosyltransferase involved in cell wall biosynthesis